MSFIEKTKRFLPVFIWMAVIFWFSSRPDLPKNQFIWVDFLFKKTAHVCEYFILTILISRAIGVKYAPQAIIYALAYAFTDEIHQLFVPGRTGMLRDILIDSLGISLAFISIITFPKWRELLSPAPTIKPKK